MEGSFSWQMEDKLFWVNLLGTVLHEGLMVRSTANHEGRAIHLKIKPLPVNRIVEVFIPEVNC